MKGITDTILMVRPKNFGTNPDTITDNHFQEEAVTAEKEGIKVKAIQEFDKMVAELQRNDIEVIVIDDTESPVKPDAIFPNNWFTTHQNGSIVTYPMKPDSRRLERREDIVDLLQQKKNLKKRYGFEYLEEEEQFLEGTGSMILDRVNEIVYASISLRTDIRVLEKFAVLFGYKKVIFHSFGRNGESIYHTNVMMTLGHTFAILCTECITNDEERKEIVASLEGTGKEIIDISLDQVEAFAGNMLQLKSKLGELYLVMSTTAYSSLTAQQIDNIQAHNKIITIPIPTIEKYGGGSVRCMIAEIFGDIQT